MPEFKVVLIEHGYATTEYERKIIARAGGEFIDAEQLGLAGALKQAEEADGVLCRRLEINSSLIQRLHRCKIIVRYGVGTDNVDLTAATAARIIVGHVPGYCRDEVAEHTMGLLLACARRIVSTHIKMERGEWEVHRAEPIYRIAGKTLGIVGFGNVGRALAEKLMGWSLNLLGFDPFIESVVMERAGVNPVTLAELLSQSDFVTLHCPLLPETRHLINDRTLSQMKPGAILINAARGQVVDTAALCRFLDAGHLAAAGLDVFEIEPLPKDSPLRTHPAIVLTDHTAWYSEESQMQLQKTAAEEVVRVCTGGLPHSIANPEVLHHLGRWNEWQPPEHVQWQLKRLKLATQGPHPTGDV